MNPKTFRAQLALIPFALLIILIVSISDCHAQLELTRAEIIKLKGKEYTTGETVDNVPYISYVNQRPMNKGGFISSTTTYYFGDDKCDRIRIIEPISTINEWVKTFNDSKVKLSELKWKDYENNMFIEVSNREETVIINFYQ